MGDWPEAAGHGNGREAACLLKPSIPTGGTQSNFPFLMPSEDLAQSLSTSHSSIPLGASWSRWRRDVTFWPYE